MPNHNLTRREREVMDKVSYGLANHTIAGLLNISVKTVEHHLNNIFSKYEVCHDERVNPRVAATLDYLRYVHSR